MKTTMASTPTKQARTEIDGTSILDLQTYRRDAYGAFARGEVTREDYERQVAALQVRIDALRRQ